MSPGELYYDPQAFYGDDVALDLKGEHLLILQLSSTTVSGKRYWSCWSIEEARRITVREGFILESYTLLASEHDPGEKVE